MSENWERLLPRVVAGGILLILALGVLSLRLHRITELPQGIQSDEGPDGVYALQVLQGEHAVFFPEAASGREWMGVYAIALTTSALGRSILAFRLPTALASAVTVFAVFWLGRLFFGREGSGRPTPWRGLFIGGVGAGVLAVSLGQTIIGRASLRANYLPLLLTLCFALLWWGWSEPAVKRNWWRIALAGLCAGLLPYTYIPSRFTPFLFFLFGLSFLFPLHSGTKEFLRAELPRAAIFVGVTSLVAAPILIYFANNPEHFFIRSREVWILREGEGTVWGGFLRNAWEHLLAFGFHGDRRERYNFDALPMLNPWEALAFWFGVGMAVLRWQRRPAYRLLLLWLVVLLVPAMLSLDADLGPNTLRMIGAAPAVYLLIGVGLWEAYELLRIRLWPASAVHSQIGGRNVSTGDGQAGRKFESQVTVALAVLVAGLVVLRGLRTYQTYFREWAVTPAFYLTYQGEWADAARILSAQPTAAGAVYLLPYRFDEHYGFEYLYHGAAPAYVIRAIRPDLPQTVQSTLAAIEGLSTVRVLDWNDSLNWSSQGDVNLVTLLDKFGRYQSSETFSNFQIHTYTDIALDRPWTFYGELEPWAVRYDGGISLLGLALGQGEQQFPSQQTVSLVGGDSLWVALQWQTESGLETDFAISLRLQSADGQYTYQTDHVLGNSTFARTRDWFADLPVDTLFHLDLPADLPPGEYELKLIVYNTETLIPTVEIDVWKPELLLTRLLLQESGRQE